MSEAATPVTFEAGYDDLRRIVARLDADDVSVHEMCELFARGKGLEQALRTYLEAQQGRLDEIEAGEHLPEFVVVAPGAPAAQEAARSAPAVEPAAAAAPPRPAPAPERAAPPAPPAPVVPTESGPRIAFRAERRPLGGAPQEPGTPEHDAGLPF